MIIDNIMIVVCIIAIFVGLFPFGVVRYIVAANKQAKRKPRR